uniref:OmpA family protein n=1 Tax=Epilithonimonas hominis TaxID=420404 RepID=UPI0028B15544
TPVIEKDVTASGPAKIDVSRSGQTHEIVSERDSGGSIWKWLLPLLLLLLLGWFFWKQCNKKAEAVPVSTTDSTSTEVNSADYNGDTVIVKRETMVVILPSGQTLQAYKGGIEDQIVTFLKSDDYNNATEDQLKDKWFNFDNLNFEFGKAVLTPDSKVQLENLKSILAEFPDAKIKIGAYTDKKGDANTNLKLSNERANTVKSSLNSAQVLEAEGYGSKFAKVPAEASDKERESDRKTAIRFVK